MGLKLRVFLSLASFPHYAGFSTLTRHKTLAMAVDLKALYPKLVHLLLDPVFVVDESGDIVFIRPPVIRTIRGSGCKAPRNHSEQRIGNSTDNHHGKNEGAGSDVYTVGEAFRKRRRFGSARVIQGNRSLLAQLEGRLVLIVNVLALGYGAHSAKSMVIVHPDFFCGRKSHNSDKANR